MNIISTETHTPNRISTNLISEEVDCWRIGCEGCGEQRLQAKVTYKNAGDPFAKTPSVIEVIHTAPEARRCKACGPFPKN